MWSLKVQFSDSDSNSQGWKGAALRSLCQGKEDLIFNSAGCFCCDMVGSLNPGPSSPTSPMCFGAGRTLGCAALFDTTSDSSTAVTG